jgi:hypothetical protein
VFLNGSHQIVRPPVVQKEDALPQSPEWSGAELVSFCLALFYAIVQVGPQIVRRLLAGFRIAYNDELEPRS